MMTMIKATQFSLLLFWWWWYCCLALLSIQQTQGWVAVPLKSNGISSAHHHRHQHSSSSSSLSSSASCRRQRSLVSQFHRFHHSPYSSSSTALDMNWLDDTFSNFLQKREGDFIPLDNNDKEFGPGPLLLLYNVPPGIANDEIQDMLQDGAPTAFPKRIKLIRIEQLLFKDDAKKTTKTTNVASLLELSLGDALDQMATGKFSTTKSSSSTKAPSSSPPAPNGIDKYNGDNNNKNNINTCVLFFSGFRNNEMMSSYQIMGNEIYQESQGQIKVACAKAVPNAMDKPLRQVLEEIVGDHQLAMDLEEHERKRKQKTTRSTRRINTYTAYNICI